MAILKLINLNSLKKNRKNFFKFRKYDEESARYVIATPQEKEWEETSILLIQALGKMIKSFMALNLNKIKENSYFKENILDNLVNKFSKIMRLTTPELACITLKCVQEIYYSRVNFFIFISA